MSGFDVISDEIRDNLAALTQEPVLMQMASELPAGLDLHSYEFMCHAREEYNIRTANLPESVRSQTIGGPAEALRRIVADQPTNQGEMK